MRVVFTEEQIEFLKTHYSKMGADWCSNELGISKEKIVSKTSKLGLRVGKECLSKVLSKSKANYESNRSMDSFLVNPKEFMDLKNPYCIYLLGLIWADGHVTYANNKSKTPLIKHTSLEDDSNEFLPIFLKTGKWKSFIFENTKLGYKPVRVINTSNRVLGEWLVENNYKNKNSTPKFINNIDGDLLHYFFRGLTDGDGCFENNIHKQKKTHKKQLRFTLSSGCDQDWSFVEGVLVSIGLSYNIRKLNNKKGCTSYLHLNNQESFRWAEYIYKGEQFGLSRKKNKWLDVIKHNQSLLRDNQ